MQELVVHTWRLIMDHRFNPLKNIPDFQTRHVVLQLLAWMWCVIFSMSLGSMAIFGISALAHALLIAGIVITVSTFEMSARKPEIFSGLGRGIGGEHE